MKKVSIISALLLMFGMDSLLASEIRKIVHPDGRVEFTNKHSAARQAQTTSRTYYKYQDASGVVSYTDKKPKKADFTVLRFDCYACDVNSSINWNTTPLLSTANFDHYINQSAKRHQVDPALVKAVIHAESAFNPMARSRVGAQGLMQLMPATAAELGVRNAFDPEQNIDGGVRYLAMMLKRFNNDVRLATAAYNAGPGAVQRHNGVPAYAETQAYVQRVAMLTDRYR